MRLTEEGSLVNEGALGTHSRYCRHLLGGNWPRGGARLGLWVSLLPPCRAPLLLSQLLMGRANHDGPFTCQILA